LKNQSYQWNKFFPFVIVNTDFALQIKNLPVSRQAFVWEWLRLHGPARAAEFALT
jgi:hypothetical protein